MNLRNFSLRRFALNINQFLSLTVLVLLVGQVRSQTEAEDCAVFEKIYRQSNLTLPWTPGNCCALTNTDYIPPAFGCVNGRVVNVALQALGLSGPIPSLDGLNKLQVLFIYSNKLNGTIPSLANLTDLVYFYIGINNLVGPMPSFKGLFLLQYVDLSSNNLSGPVTSFEDQGAAFSQLSIQDNHFTGPIPDLSRAANMSFLRLEGNNFTGDVANRLPGDVTYQCFITRGNTNRGLYSCSENIPRLCRTENQAVPAGTSAQCPASNSTSSQANGTQVTINAGPASAASAASTIVSDAGSVVGSTSSPSSSPTGAIIGGVAGGVAGLAILGLAGIFLVRSRKRRTSTEILDPPPGTSQRAKQTPSKLSLRESGVESRSITPAASEATLSAAALVEKESQSAHPFFFKMAESLGVKGDAMIRNPVPSPSFVQHLFEPTNTDEIRLIPGHFVLVEFYFRDGWASGTNLDTGHNGLFPIDCLRMAPNLDSGTPGNLPRLESVRKSTVVYPSTPVGSDPTNVSSSSAFHSKSHLAPGSSEVDATVASSGASEGPVGTTTLKVPGAELSETSKALGTSSVVAVVGSVVQDDRTVDGSDKRLLSTPAPVESSQSEVMKIEKSE
ncbi:hypothetical protein HDU93_005419 [Gonapodya sp. JEL0774]|nr:hypothetical protein HDU93_005419 [Gonapodya sp. JEL0774]